ncbi:anti-sigma factor [Amycolatopsis rhabdoformis]|uniref:Regulator of SigK n=1 Tax=Amycolatopsis rhabdoformis TaxID=1448059 RepID=A0ABZ1IKX8_9PSEU|nr:anti-sigma factor [Amycolatopsis rhabdoformis]WSE34150.1 anti-sigma factor [Amycolatopsis rhabdoformis]
MSIDDAHLFAGAYALDAVDDLERARFEKHLAECGQCAHEVTEFRQVAALLGAAVEVAPSPRLRSGVLAEVSRTRQVPPAPRRLPAARPWRTRAVVAVAVVAAIGGVVVGGSQLFGGGPEPSTVASAQHDVRLSGDAVSTTARAVGGGSASTDVSRALGKIVVTAQDLPALDAAHAYQVWLIGPRGPQSAGLLTADSGASVVAALPADADRVGITVEPAAGSPQPTTAGVVAVALP